MPDPELLRADTAPCGRGYRPFVNNDKIILSLFTRGAAQLAPRYTPEK